MSRFRYKPHRKTDPAIDSDRCAASVHDDASCRSHQCTRPRSVGDWCKQHAPVSTKGTGKFLYSTKAENSFDGKVGKVALAKTKVLKETPRQYRIEREAGGAFGYKTIINKVDMERSGRYGAGAEAIFTDARSAILWREDQLMRQRDDLTRKQAATKAQLRQIVELLKQHKE